MGRAFTAENAAFRRDAPTGVRAPHGDNIASALTLAGTTVPDRYLQVHDDLTGSRMLTALSYRPDRFTSGQANRIAGALSLSNAPAGISGAAPAPTFAGNHGSNQQTHPNLDVTFPAAPYVAGVPLPRPFVYRLPLPSPFASTGVGALVWDLEVQARPTPQGPMVLDAVTGLAAELDAAGCEAVVSQLAYSQGLVASPLDRARGLWEFVNINGAKRAELLTHATPLTPAEVLRMRDVRIFVSTSVTVQHVRASIAAQTMRPFFASAGGASLNLGTTGNESVILLQGLADVVAQALDFIANTDQPQALPKVEDDRLASLESRVRTLEQAVKRLEGDKAK